MSAAERPVLSAAEAARAAGVSPKTIGRALKAGRIPGAERLPSGGWAVPVEGLLAAGYPLHRTEPEPVVETPQPEVERLRLLEAELAEVRRERDVAVAELRRADESLADVRLALRALSAGTDPEGPTTVPATAARGPEGPTGGPVSRWWRRGR